MSTEKQPEALQLADEIDACKAEGFVSPVPAELRRQHARIEELEAQEVELCTLYGIAQAENGKLRAELEAIGAGGVNGPLMTPLPGAQEAVAWAMFADNGNIRLWSKKPIPHPDAIPLYAAPQPALSAGWVSVKDRLPPCRDDQDYIGINSAGFAGIFNAVADIAGNVYCMMETAEESVSIMSDLSIWKPFTRPLPVEPSMDGKSNG